MRRRLVSTAIALVLGVAAIGVTGCSEGSSPSSDALNKVNADAKQLSPYLPQNKVEFNNYNSAQKLYDDPATIIWCTAFPQSNTSPLVTVPIAGKLTSSTTTFFDPEKIDWDSDGNIVTDNRSVDGLFHPNPPQYRYGFTPGGQYVDFFNLPTLCTTQPLEFQRQSVSVKVDGALNQATKQAQDALQSGNKAQAQAILQAAAGN